MEAAFHEITGRERKLVRRDDAPCIFWIPACAGMTYISGCVDAWGVRWALQRRRGEESAEGGGPTFGRRSLDQVGAAVGGSFLGLVGSPFFDFGVVAGDEDFGDLVAAVFARAGVLRVFEAAVSEGFLSQGFFIADDAFEESDDGVDQDDGCGFTAGEDVVADGDFGRGEDQADSFVETFVVAGHDDQAVVGGEVADERLIESPALRGHEDSRSAALVGGFDGFDGFDDGLGAEDHSGSAAEGFVIDLAVLVSAVGPDVGADDFDEAALPGTSDNAVVEEIVDLLGKQRQDVDAHGSPTNKIGKDATAALWLFALGARLGPGLGVDAGLFEEAFDRLAGLGADAEPIFDAVAVHVELRLFALGERVIEAQFLDHPAVAGRADVHCVDPVRRPIPASKSLESQLYRHGYPPNLLFLPVVAHRRIVIAAFVSYVSQP